MTGKNFQRLVWKEYREGWPVVAAFLVLPVLLFFIGRAFPTSIMVSAMIFTVMFGVPFTAILWASEKRRTIKQGRDMLAAVLPVSPLQDWAASFLLPAVAVGIGGGWMCMLCSATPNAWETGSAALKSAFSVDTALKGTLIVASVFMLTSFVSKNVSHVLGIIVGTICGIFAIPAATGIPDFAARVAYVPIVLAFAGLGVSELRKAGPKPLKALTFVTLAVLIVWPVYKEIALASREIGAGVRSGTLRFQDIARGFHEIRLGETSVSSPILTWDGAQVMRMPNTRSDSDSIGFYRPKRIYGGPSAISKSKHKRVRQGIPAFRNGVVSYHNSQTEQKLPLPHLFPSVAIPIDVDGSGQVDVLSQQPGQAAISLFRWNPRTDRVTLICRFTGVPDSLGDSVSWSGAHYWSQHAGYSPALEDPNGNSLLLNLRSSMGTGRDLWLIDIKTGTPRLLLSNASFAWDNRKWVGDTVYLFNENNSHTENLPALEVNTRDYTVKPLLPEGRLK